MKAFGPPEVWSLLDTLRANTEGLGSVSGEILGQVFKGIQL
jgi:hypothetical protein